MRPLPRLANSAEVPVALTYEQRPTHPFFSLLRQWRTASGGAERATGGAVGTKHFGHGWLGSSQR